VVVVVVGAEGVAAAAAVTLAKHVMILKKI
jgi:hypothetical protein